MDGISNRDAADQAVQPGSNRQFGLVMAGAFGVLTLIGVWKGSTRLWVGAIVVAVLFMAAALTAPAVLNPLNRAWLRFGLLLHRVTTPIVLAIMFFAVITPIGLIMRALGKRPVPLGFERHGASYWIKRATSAPGPMTKQY